MADAIGLTLLALLLLIALSALLNGAEAAYFSLGRARLKRLRQAQPETPRVPLVDRPHDLLVTLLVAITVLKIAASAIAATASGGISRPPTRVAVPSALMSGVTPNRS